MAIQPQEFTSADADVWRAKLSTYLSVSRLLRDLSAEYGVSRNDAGVLLYELFDSFSLDDISYVWKWDFDGSGKGLSDEGLDQRLGHLLGK
ncbi:hypothetical protein CV_2774 [Chromobacterium violaceum ATCC 12472]|uniref:Uncharacterized protein n=1 Tax=Chromobacterium violaceum (strain ATCC 12472 / DSM 30191 / JCM 1249 / CCUG 213 / NBRC 12614 / NCIMB 9131 / NCTC 9757 / MK) TaxID=243365 RepID=Q7NUC6_CHRVO|nr:hypothetical protein CV_2774 [Chromobacterium violaceum ATCC 12472]